MSHRNLAAVKILANKLSDYMAPLAETLSQNKCSCFQVSFFDFIFYLFIFFSEYTDVCHPASFTNIKLPLTILSH